MYAYISEKKEAKVSRLEIRNNKKNFFVLIFLLSSVVIIIIESPKETINDINPTNELICNFFSNIHFFLILF